MNKSKFFIFIILVSVMLAVMPVTGEIQNITPAAQINASQIQIPPLQFDTLQEKVVVNDELRAGHVLENLDQVVIMSSAEQSSSSLGNTDLPAGAIIYHENNVTTVFNAQGDQLFSADDDRAVMVPTNKGDQPATFVQEVPSNSTIVTIGDSLHVIYNGTRILTVIYANSSDNSSVVQNNANKPILQSSGGGAGVACNFGSDYFEGTQAPYIEGVDTYPTMIATPSQFDAEWIVPRSPVGDPGYWSSPGHGQYAKPITIWTGFYGCPSSVGSRLLQPVLEWYVCDSLMTSCPTPTTARWTAAVWYVWGSPSITVNGVPDITFIHSERKTGINSGERMRGSIWIDPAGGDAHAYISDISPWSSAGTSSLTLTEYSQEGGVTLPNRMLRQNLYATAMMEGWQGIYHSGSADNFPGRVTFSNFALTDKDGNNLLSQIPMHSYINTKYYSGVSGIQNLTIYNRWPNDVTLVTNSQRTNRPVADFTASTLYGLSSVYVPFTDISNGSPFFWLWDFGDGGISTDQNPFHYYSSPGTYTVNLTVWGDGGINSKVKLAYIIAYYSLIPVYNVNIDSGTAPLTVQFEDTSRSNATVRTWDFGDGTTSDQKIVSHTYAQAGTYNAVLKLGYKNTSITNTSATQVIIVKSVPPVANFSVTPPNGPAPLTVLFTDTSTNTPTAWNWNFGDGNTSAEQNPVHIYVLAGNYLVSLTATNSGGSNTTTRTNYIMVQPPTEVRIGSGNISQPGGNTTLVLNLTFAPKGLSGYNFNLSVSNSTVAQITSVSFPPWASSMNSAGPLPATRDVLIKASDVNSLVEIGASEIPLANVTVRGLSHGVTEITLSRTNFDDDDGTDIPHTPVNGTLTVGSP
jgi:PKD repeat protein